MATNMFPSINPAPLGLDALDVQDDGVGVEIEKLTNKLLDRASRIAVK